MEGNFTISPHSDNQLQNILTKRMLKPNFIFKKETYILRTNRNYCIQLQL